MHYKNGREAKNGEKAVLFLANGFPVTGILYDAVAGNDYCNGRLAVITMNDPWPNLKDCLHLEDVLKMISPEASGGSVTSSSIRCE